MALTRDSFLKYDSASLKPEKVDVPLLGDHCFVRRLTAGEKDKFEARVVVRNKGRNWRAEVVVLVAVDEDGNQLFSSSDVNELTQLPAAAIEPIVDAYSRINAMSAEEMAELSGN